MELPLDTSAVQFTTSKPAVRDDDGEYSLMAGVSGPDDAGALKIYFGKENPRIEPGPFELESASVTARHVRAGKVRQAPRQESSS